jgi:hypothetical protein
MRVARLAPLVGGALRLPFRPRWGFDAFLTKERLELGVVGTLDRTGPYSGHPERDIANAAHRKSALHHGSDLSLYIAGEESVAGRRCSKDLLQRAPSERPQASRGWWDVGNESHGVHHAELNIEIDEDTGAISALCGHGIEGKVLRRQADADTTVDERDEEGEARATEAALVKSTRTYQDEPLVGRDPSDTSRDEPNDQHGTERQQYRPEDVRRHQSYLAQRARMSRAIEGLPRIVRIGSNLPANRSPMG